MPGRRKTGNGAAKLSIQAEAFPLNNPETTNQMTAIVNAQIFDGENVISNNKNVVLIKRKEILAVTDKAPGGAAIIDARGATLMPGFIDSHVHTDMNGLRDALKFGVTTKLGIMGRWTLMYLNLRRSWEALLTAQACIMNCSCWLGRA